MKPTTHGATTLYTLFSTLFCVCLIAANLFATKQITFFGIEATGGLIVFPLSYIVNDCVCEVWGYARMRQLIWTGFAMNFLVCVFGLLCDWLPAPPYYDDAGGFHAVFGLAPRVTAASFAAFVAGSFANAYVMSRMKLASGGRRFQLRAIVSTLFGEAADSLLFFPLAIGGLVPTVSLLQIMLCELLLKTGYEIVVLPITTRVVQAVKRHEGTDVFDENISYNIFSLK